MKNLNRQYLDTVSECWKNTIKKNVLIKQNTYGIRQEIFDSWKRSQQFHVDPESTIDSCISNKALQSLYEENASLLKVAYPYLQNLYTYMRGSNYMIQLVEKNGCVLKTITDDLLIKTLIGKLSSQSEGYLASEDVIGTNSTAISLKLKKPFQVIGAEHYQKRNQEVICSSAPIFDEASNLIGCLTMVCPIDLYQLNTLGVVKATADAIERELKTRNALNTIATTNTLLSTCIEAIEKGILLLDSTFHIVLNNKKALSLLSFSSETDLIGKSIYEIIPVENLPGDLKSLDRSLSSIEFTLHRPNEVKLDLIMDVHVNYNSNQHIDSAIITLNSQDKFNKTATKILNSRAIYTLDSIIGTSSAIKEIKQFGVNAAKSSSNVLILGESGTGKELLAQSIHNASNRASQPFITVNCGSIPKDLIASELFGYERGAFTGADKSGNPGKFELANKGTIFLDEIGDMPFELQVSLLRVLQEKEVVRLGGKHAKKIDVRIIAATHQDLAKKVATNHFRADLFYRLNVLNITMPPLRYRISDIKPLVHHFIKQYNRTLGKSVRQLSKDAWKVLYNYQWPGNVRELENAIERAINLASSQIINADNLSVEENMNIPVSYSSQNDNQPILSEGFPFHNNYAMEPKEYSNNECPSLSPDVQEYERLIGLFQQEKGHTKSVAQILGIPLSTLYSKLRKYNISPRDYKTWP